MVDDRRAIGTASTRRMRSILIDHSHRYPEWAEDDVYKLTHQAAMGSEHAVTDGSRAREWLLQELAGMGPGPDEPLIDPISPDSRIVRVHLRPLARLHLRPELLLGAFLQTAMQIPRSPETLAELAGVAIQLAVEGMLRLPSDRITERFAEMQADGYPAVHHSLVFTELYRPAYRVVAQDLLPKEIMAGVHGG